MRIREATAADHERLRQITRASFDRVYAFFAVRGLRRAWPLLVAEADGRAVGFLEGGLFEGTPPIGYVYFVAVDPDARRKGIGRELVEEALRRFAARGATRVFAAVPRDNDASAGLFASLRFERIPRRALWRWYGWHGFGVEMRMVLAPHEALMVRTFTDPSPASPQGSPPTSL